MGDGGRGFWEDHLIFRRTKGRSVVTENPKGGITENFGRIQRGGPLKFAYMENEDVGGIAKVILSY